MKDSVRLFASLTGIFLALAFVAGLLDVQSQDATVSAVYAAGIALMLSIAAGFCVLTLAAWSWTTFNRGKRDLTEPKASASQRTLSVMGLLTSSPP